MITDIFPGIVLVRHGSAFMIVKSDKKTWTGQDAFGLVDLDSGIYNSIDVSLNTLQSIINQVKLIPVANSLAEFFANQRGINTNVQ